MSNAISFFETMGQEATLRHGTQDDMKLALANAQIAPALQSAILGENRLQIEALLGAQPNVCCGFAPAKEPDEEGEEPAKRDDDEIRARGEFLSFASAA